MLVIVIPVGMEISSVFSSLLGCGLPLLSMAMSMSPMTMSVSTMTMSVSTVTMSMTSLLVRMCVSMVVNMSMTMTCDGLDVL